jgi:hypothetical protein
MCLSGISSMGILGDGDRPLAGGAVPDGFAGPHQGNLGALLEMGVLVRGLMGVLVCAL